MRTLCDVCESAAAILFCAADEAALCRSCDEKVFMEFQVFQYRLISCFLIENKLLNHGLLMDRILIVYV